MWESFENEISSQSLDFIKWVRPRTFPHFLFLYLKNEQIFFFNPIILNIIWNTRRSAVFSHLISSFFFSYHISRLFSQFYFPPFSFFISYFPLVLSRFNFHLLSYRLNSGIIIRWFWGFFWGFFLVYYYHYYYSHLIPSYVPRFTSRSFSHLISHCISRTFFSSYFPLIFSRLIFRCFFFLIHISRSFFFHLISDS